MKTFRFLWWLLVILVHFQQVHGWVILEKLPDSGIQPQVVTAPDHSVHLIYLAGDPKASDVFYRRRIGNEAWSAPVQVNSQPGSAIAIGTIRGAQLALGRSGTVHVAWNGSGIAEPKPAGDGTPMLVASLRPGDLSFSPQQNVMLESHELDGGGSVAADAEGRVWVIWHASPPGNSGETNRVVYLAESTNDGRSFSRERRVSPVGLGACGCCGLTAMSRGSDRLSILFRSARSMVQRDMVLLESSDGGVRFSERLSHPWRVGMCPMSSANLSVGGGESWASWESEGRVHFASIGSGGEIPRVLSVGNRDRAKHPRVVANGKGEVLVVWSEGTGWQRGGLIAWQVFDAGLNVTRESGGKEGLTVWNFPAAYATSDGNFVILW